MSAIWGLRSNTYCRSRNEEKCGLSPDQSCENLNKLFVFLTWNLKHCTRNFKHLTQNSKLLTRYSKFLSFEDQGESFEFWVTELIFLSGTVNSKSHKTSSYNSRLIGMLKACAIFKNFQNVTHNYQSQILYV